MDEREEAWEEIVDVTLGCDDVRAAHTGLDRGGTKRKPEKDMRITAHLTCRG